MVEDGGRGFIIMYNLEVVYGYSGAAATEGAMTKGTTPDAITITNLLDVMIPLRDCCDGEHELPHPDMQFAFSVCFGDLVNGDEYCNIWKQDGLRRG